MTIENVHGAVDHGSHIVVDCDIAGIGRVQYTVVPGASDDAPAHAALEAMIAAGDIVPVPAAGPTAHELKVYAAERRWAKETGGVQVNLGAGAMTVPSDDRTKVLLMGAAGSMADGDTAPLVVGDAVVTLTGAHFKAIYAAIVGHVAACFAEQRDVIAAIDDGTITTRAQIDAAFA